MSPSLRRFIAKEYLTRVESLAAYEHELLSSIRQELGDPPLAHSLSAKHECEPSPIGLCVYNDMTDPSHGRCVFCRQPEERP